MKSEYFQVLYKISRHLTDCPDNETRLSGIIDLLEGGTSMRRATLLLLSASGEELVYERAAEGEMATGHGNIEYKKGEGVVGRVLQDGEPVVVRRIEDEPEFRNRIHSRGEAETRAYGFICVPIILGTETFGALAADFPSGGEELFRDAGKFLLVVAGMIAHDVKLNRANAIIRQENLRLHTQMGDFQPDNMIGCSGRMRSVYQKISQVAPSDSTVLIRGESGTGKELVAAAVHYNSKRSDKPFVTVNCAALSESLLESELFGHVKGAFTGAHDNRRGRLREAEGGTLFLDEIGDFSPSIQVKLLRLLQEKEYSVVGENEVRKANVRFVCATNRDLEKAVEEESFRQDLYYRINVFPIFLPPLRERREDILPLANHFVEKYASQMNKPLKRISTTAIDMLVDYHWPGNVREMENCIQHGVLVATGNTLQGRDLPPTLAMPDKQSSVKAGSLKERVDILERDMITDALKRTGGNVAAASRELGITSRMVRYKIEKFAIRVGSGAKEN